MAGKFKMHGTLTLRVEGPLLILEGEGPWNKESLRLWDKETMAKVQSLYGSAWGVLGIFRGEAIYVPDAAEQLKRRIAHERTLGRVATAVVLENVKTPIFSEQHLKSLYEDAGDTVAMFSDVNKAKIWLKSQIEEAVYQQ